MSDFPISRESGVFVCLSDDESELRLHQDERGRYHWHRWRLAQWDMQDELTWRGPVAHGLTAGEIYDAAEALRKLADGAKTTKGGKK